MKQEFTDTSIKNHLVDIPDTVEVESAKSSEPETPKSGGGRVSFLDLFLFTRGRDKGVLALAIGFSCWQGFIFPIFSMVFGTMGSSFVTTASVAELQRSIDEHFLGMLALAAVILLSSFVSASLWNYLSVRQSAQLKSRYFRCFLFQRAAWFDARRVEEMSAEFVEQVGDFALLFSQKMNFYFLYYAQAVGGLVVGLYTACLFTTFVLGLFCVLIAVLYLAVRRIQAGPLSHNRNLTRLGALVEQAVRLLKTVKSFNGEEHEIARFTELSRRDRDAWREAGYRGGWFWGLFVFSTLAVFGLMFCAGLVLVSGGYYNINARRPYSIADIIAVVFCIIPGLLSLAHIGNLEWALEGGKRAIRKIQEMTERPETEPTGARQPGALRGDIEFRNVSFAYPANPQAKVLRNLSLTIRAGQKVGIVGPSGSGKTTIIQLLERFYDPDEGQILLDGVDLRDYDLHALRARLGLVSQQPVLFTDTVFANVSLEETAGRSKEAEARVWAALAQVNAQDFVAALPRGLETVVSNGGGSLSNGQKQKLAVARTLFRDPALFLFDESTSAFDKSDELDVQRRLEDVTAGATNIHVAHKIASVVNADVIYVMQEGRVVEQGTHAQLMALPAGVYSNLARHQASELAPLSPGQRSPSPGKRSPRLSRRSSARPDDLAVSCDPAASAPERLFDPKRESMIATIFRYLGARRKRLILYSVVSSAMVGAFSPVVGFLMANIVYYLGRVEAAIGDAPAALADSLPFVSATSELYQYILADFLVAILALFFCALQQGTLSDIAATFLHRLKEKFIRRMMYTDVAHFDGPENQPASLALLLTREEQALSTTVCQNFPIILQALSSYATSLAIGLYLSWRITLVSLALAPLLLLFKVFESRFTVAYSAQTVKVDAVVLSETLGNMKLVRSLNGEARAVAQFEARSAQGRGLNALFAFLAGLVFGLSQLFNYIVYGLIFLWGTRIAIAHGLDFADTLAAIFTLVFSINSMLVLNDQISAYLAARAGFAALRDKMHLPSRIELDPGDARNRPALFRRKRPDFAGRIEFRNVSFAYDPAQGPVLKDLSFEIRPGQSVGFFGRSGAGKSTIIELLLRFYEPQAGEILLDGVNLRDLDLAHLRSLFGVARQEGDLFNGTVSYNIQYNLALSEQELLGSAREANILEFTARDPEGFLKNVGNKGEKMSGGQKQRIVLGRIFARKQKVCLLDEPTSALDAAGEALVLEALDRLRASRTSVTLSNRVRAIRDCANIFVMHEGRIVEQGTYEELMKLNGRFVELSLE